MPRNKLRLQLALYARPKYPGTYHYALFIAPKGAQGHAPTTKHHVKNTLQIIEGQAAQPWRYERDIIANVEDEQRLLVRVVIGKLTAPREQVEQLLESTPVYQIDYPDEAKAKTFTCRTWVWDALVKLQEQGAVTGLDQWEVLERKCLDYLKSKLAQGRWSGGWTGEPGIPLMDLLDHNTELVR